ncbi:bifunctional diaminohydroxyphosphoribosylaminopyrimidine deaminase/5-amino-6-(5-phosphoribosylamino)uracil reductase RibD [Agrobacterium larrymoorei]|uniref:bifunctional diaminohydroxyphosphoribosylaminopyrimidine deaminase/5-amino-6-(5-phosphoribosylamino)uracil reductase RibD n=1 Tax=Agrobacterium larrymoorei TaxID=160699 RepID=UPI001574463C|nr:bifunctional diaminohydroxyphosphoribosylaminopyrimidine deaminase/5-amino-6-(5-phosphoribosylamino)uracil reductase RibD [Agrobacterium larrymoorei]NTJ41804.1 bifunctional diaminohydroxyphosphoribosylaminopyrimidine deaminase/5-amino-6-(5-phosphoribosylamino)uracil reductase RibD [Agrobacterium larrymoorei]
MTTRADDERFMARAIEISRRHTGLTETNPSVGCVLVKDGQIIAEAVTSIGGRPHAERNALDIAGEAAKGATAYVTLEPCSHWGRTPPCANALVEFGIARAVVSVDDPDERVAGRGYQILRDAGISVDTGILRQESERALAGYLTRKIKKRPHVTLKLAVSADGMIGRKDEGQVAITGPEARHAVHELRARCDAILVGIGTALSDDPELNVRISGMEHHSPVRFVLDRRLDLPLASKLVKTAHTVPTVAVVIPSAALPVNVAASDPEEIQPIDQKRVGLSGAGVEILEVTDLDDFLLTLGAREMSELLVEGGAVAARAFLGAGLVDRILLFESPVIIGEDGIETPLKRADIPQDYYFIGETTYGADRCFDYERPL